MSIQTNATEQPRYSSHDVADRELHSDKSVYRVLSIVRRQMPIVLLAVTTAIGLGLVYLWATPPSFTATATVVIDTRKVQLFQQQSVLGDIPVDAGTVQTQVEIAKSDNISLAVIKEHQLIDDPEFTGPSLFGTVFGLFASDSAASDFEKTQRVLVRFQRARSVKRVGLTYVVEITFQSLSSDKAAALANAIAKTYIVDQLEAKDDAARRAGVWLQERLKKLRTQASEAEQAVIDYKEKNKIIDTGGRLISEQQLAEVNSQLILAKAATAEAKARLDRMSDIVKQQIPNAGVADALKNDTIIKLRGQYVDIAAREATWSEKYGKDHLAPANLRNQMLEIRRNIAQELQRIQQAYQSDYDIAHAREESLKRSLADAVSDKQLTSQAQIQLRELESNAQTYRSMYDIFLQRYMEAAQQQSFPITEARLISSAAPPLHKSHPKTLTILAVALAFGLVLGLGTAYGRELISASSRTRIPPAAGSSL